MKWNLSWNLPSLISCKSWSLRRIFSKFGFWSPSMFSTGHASPSIRKLKSPIQNTELYWPIISLRRDIELEIRKIKQTLKEKVKKIRKSWHKFESKSIWRISGIKYYYKKWKKKKMGYVKKTTVWGDRSERKNWAAFN